MPMGTVAEGPLFLHTMVEWLELNALSCQTTDRGSTRQRMQCVGHHHRHNSNNPTLGLIGAY